MSKHLRAKLLSSVVGASLLAMSGCGSDVSEARDQKTLMDVFGQGQGKRVQVKFRAAPASYLRAVSPQRAYALYVPQDFEPAERQKYPRFDMVLRSTDQPIWIGVIVDGTPHSLRVLDEVVRRNLARGETSTQLLDRASTRLGGSKGLAARRATILSRPEDRADMLMINTHGSSTQQSYQVIVWGSLAVADRLERLAASFEADLLDFGRTTSSFKGQDRTLRVNNQPRHEATLERAAHMQGALGEWRVLEAGALHPMASLSMEHPTSNLRLVVRHRRPGRGLTMQDLFDLVTRRHDAAIADNPQAALPRVLQKADPEHDWSWAQSGLPPGELEPRTLHIRLLRRGSMFLEILCWRSSNEPLVEGQPGCNSELGRIVQGRAPKAK